MLQFWYTGADKYNESQPDKDKSLGGFKSSSPVPNDVVSNIIGEVSEYGIYNNFTDTHAIIIENVSGTTMTDVKTYFNDTATNKYIKTFIAVVELTENTSCSPTTYSMEKIPNSRSRPTFATFHEPTSQATEVVIGDIPAGKMLGVWIRSELVDGLRDLTTCDNLSENGPDQENRENIEWVFNWT